MQRRIRHSLQPFQPQATCAVFEPIVQANIFIVSILEKEKNARKNRRKSLACSVVHFMACE
jgi:hypothetical protein